MILRLSTSREEDVLHELRRGTHGGKATGYCPMQVSLDVLKVLLQFGEGCIALQEPPLF